MHHRFYVPQWTERAEITGEELHHAKVVRLRQGEEIELFDGRGHAAAAVVESIGGEGIAARVLRPIDSREAALGLHLAMAVIQLERFELVLQKATELGAASITPMVTRFVEVRPERYRGKHARWQKIVFEAVKQSGRSAIPPVEEVMPFDAVVRRPEPRIVFDMSGPDLGAGLDAPRAESLVLLVGPEGGWSEEELQQAREAGCRFARLGPRRLRAETAALAALTAVGLVRAGGTGGAA